MTKFHFFIFLSFFLLSDNARADFGTSMLAFKCDGVSNEIIFQPFVQWNENYQYLNLNFFSEGKQSYHRVGGYSFYKAKKLETDIFLLDCNIKERRVKFFLSGYSLIIVDIEGLKYWAKEIDLLRAIGSAWDVFGPLYKIKTTKFGNWEECVAQGDVAVETDYSCSTMKGGRDNGSPR